MPLLRYPDLSLTMPSLVVNDFGENLQKLAQDLRQAREDAAVLGATSLALSAPQIGVNLRVFVWSDVEGNHHTVVNPTVVSAEGRQWEPEACLSFLGPFSIHLQQFMPGLEVQVERASTVVVRAHDHEGTLFEHELGGTPARMFQHEIDHLDGITMLDRISAPRRKQMLKAWAYMHRQSNLAIAGR